MKTATSILTVTLPTGETVLAKKDFTPLRYGNLSQAETKTKQVRESGYRAKILRMGSRFLISVELPSIPSEGFGYIFATTSGIRSNPRNRHNHQNESQTDTPYHFET